MATAPDNVDMASPVVKGPGGKTFEFFEGIKQHFRNLYGEWGFKDDDGTIMCPPFFARDYISPIGDVSGAAPLKDMVLETINGDDAEKKIFDVLKQFGEKTKQPMFVLSKLKFTEFIKYCLHQQLADELPKRFQLEFDFVIVHLNIGVILIEVKSCIKWSNSKGFNQLREREKIVKGLLPGKSGVPVYKVIALPNMDGSGYRKDDFVCLKKLDVDSCDKFSRWMEAHFNADKCGSQEKQELLTLLYKLVGQRTKVSSSPETIEFSDHEVRPEKVLSKYYKDICSQHCLKQSWESQNAKKGGKKQKADGNESGLATPQTVVKTADRPDLAELAKQIVFLNLEQLRVWEGPCHQLISGVSGSGKTILLQYRALECARKGEKVIICVPTPLNKLYEAFFKGKSISSGINIYTFEEFHKFLPKNKERFHLFVDELQICSHDHHYYDERADLNELIRRQKDPETCYCWFAYDDSQFTTSANTFTGLPDYFHLLKTNRYVRQLGQSQSHQFDITHLKTVMRSTENVCKIVNDFAQKSAICLILQMAEDIDDNECYNITAAASIKRWQVKTGHRIGGPLVEEYHTRRLEHLDVVKIIKTKLQRFSPKEVAVLVTDHSDVSYLSHKCKSLNIPVCGIGENADAIVVDHGGNAHSYEWPVVIAVGGLNVSKPALQRFMYSRAVTQLVVIKQYDLEFSIQQEWSDYMLDYMQQGYNERLQSSQGPVDHIRHEDNIQSCELLRSLEEWLGVMQQQSCELLRSLEEWLGVMQQQYGELLQSPQEPVDHMQQQSKEFCQSPQQWLDLMLSVMKEQFYDFLRPLEELLDRMQLHVGVSCRQYCIFPQFHYIKQSNGSLQAFQEWFHMQKQSDGSLQALQEWFDMQQQLLQALQEWFDMQQESDQCLQSLKEQFDRMQQQFNELLQSHKKQFDHMRQQCNEFPSHHIWLDYMQQLFNEIVQGHIKHLGCMQQQSKVFRSLQEHLVSLQQRNNKHLQSLKERLVHMQQQPKKLQLPKIKIDLMTLFFNQRIQLLEEWLYCNISRDKCQPLQKLLDRIQEKTHVYQSLHMRLENMVLQLHSNERLHPLQQWLDRCKIFDWDC